jgi:two-component system, sensor histidine kinase
VKLRTHLVGLVVLTLVPVVALTAALTVMLAREERATAERGLADTTRALQVAVDAELSSSITTLEALATSEHLDQGDLRAFYDFCRRVLPSQRTWHTITLIEAASGRTVLTTAQPFGTALPPLMDRPHVQRAIATRRPQISDLVAGRTIDGRFISVVVPVVRGAGVRYVAAALYDVNVISSVLSRVNLPPDWTAAVLDRRHVIVARTRMADRYLGQPATADLAARVAAGTEGAFEDVNKEGIPNHGAFFRSSLSGWTVVVGAPSTVLYTSLRRSLALAVGGGAVLVLLGAGVALVYGRRIAAPVMALADAAASFGSRTPPPRVVSPVDEVNAVSETITAAAAERLRVETALLQSKQMLESLIQAAPIAIVVVGRDGIAHHWNRAAEGMFGWSAEDVLGKRLPYVPPDRSDELFANIERTLSGRPLTGVESQRQRKDGTRIPVRLFTAPLGDGGGHPHAIIGLVEDITERKRAEERAAFLADAAVTLSSSLDYPRVLAGLARLATPRLADMCAVDVMDEDGVIRRVALVHVDPAKEAIARELREQFGFSEDSVVAEVLRTAKPVLLAEVFGCRARAGGAR